MKIISAVTTCDRPDGVSYLAATIKSLTDSGFTPEIVVDTERSGSWPTLRRALAGLIERSGDDSDGLVVWQDDIKVAKGLHDWMQVQLWPGDMSKIGVVSLYTPSTDHLRPGWFSHDELPVFRPAGGCALCFTVHGARRLLGYSERAMLTGSDTTTALFFRREGLLWMMHSPSLVEHIGLRSAIGPKEIGLSPDRTAGQWCEDVSMIATHHGT